MSQGNAMRDKNMDEPDEYERRTIDRDPLTKRLNRELLDSFRRSSRLKEERQSVGDHKTLGTNVPANRKPDAK
jgi:hypothetical protein